MGLFGMGGGGADLEGMGGVSKPSGCWLVDKSLSTDSIGRTGTGGGAIDGGGPLRGCKLLHRE